MIQDIGKRDRQYYDGEKYISINCDPINNSMFKCHNRALRKKIKQNYNQEIYEEKEQLVHTTMETQDNQYEQMVGNYYNLKNIKEKHTENQQQLSIQPNYISINNEIRKIQINSQFMFPPKKDEYQNTGFYQNGDDEQKMQAEDDVNSWLQPMKQNFTNIKSRQFHFIIFWEALNANWADFKLIQIQHNGTITKVWIKLIYHNEAFTRNNFIQFSTNQTYFLNQFHHKNIIQIQGYYTSKLNNKNESDQMKGLILRYEQGEYLQTLIKKHHHKLTQMNVRRKIIRNLLVGLAQIHDKKIINRSIQPNKIWITDQAEAIIMDFSFAIRQSKHQYEQDENLFSIYGAPGYMAPEILRYATNQTDQLTTTKSDIFSVGTILYEMITGTKLFTSNNRKQLIEENKNCDISSKLKELYHYINDSQFQLLQKMLAIKPNHRISAKEALQQSYFCENIDNQQYKQPIKLFQLDGTQKQNYVIAKINW